MLVTVVVQGAGMVWATSYASVKLIPPQSVQFFFFLLNLSAVMKIGQTKTVSVIHPEPIGC